jgi:hypothetical protein
MCRTMTAITLTMMSEHPPGLTASTQVFAPPVAQVFVPPGPSFCAHTVLVNRVTIMPGHTVGPGGADQGGVFHIEG